MEKTKSDAKEVNVKKAREEERRVKEQSKANVRRILDKEKVEMAVRVRLMCSESCFLLSDRHRVT